MFGMTNCDGERIKHGFRPKKTKFKSKFYLLFFPHCPTGGARGGGGGFVY
jgi:hypothetical protein